MKTPFFVLAVLAGLAFSANTTLVNLPADSWYQVPNTKMSAVCMPGLSSYSCWSVSGAWGGAAYDKDDRIMIVWGGGHGDSYDNSVYTFSLDTLIWRRLKDNTGSYVGSDPLSNGDPVSRHTYDGLAYITHARRFFGYNGAVAVSGGASTVVWTFDVAAKRWYNMNASGPKPGQSFGGNGGSAYDPVTKNVYYASIDAVYAYNFDSNAWTSYMPLVGQEWGRKRAILDSKRRILFVTGTDHDKLFAYDLTAKTDITASWVTTGDNSAMSCGQAAIDYDVAADQIIGWTGSGPVHVLNMTTKVWTRRSTAGGPTASCSNGTYSRFRYIPEDNVFVLLNAGPTENPVYQDVWFYKNTAGLGTSSEKVSTGLPNSAWLKASPNPFQPGTALSFTLEKSENVSLKVFDATGKMVSELFNGRKSAGAHNVAFNSTSFAPGVYFCKLSAGNKESMIRLSLLK